MSETDLMALLARYPGLRHTCARSEAESAAAVEQYEKLYQERPIHTATLRNELLALLEAHGHPRTA